MEILSTDNDQTRESVHEAFEGTLTVKYRTEDVKLTIDVLEATIEFLKRKYE